MIAVSAKEVLQKAYSEGYAVGAFNGTNVEITRAIIEAAEEEKAPVFLQLSMGILDYLGFHIGVGMAISAANSSKVPVVLHLDHGRDLRECVLCLRSGFTSIMYDGTEKLLELVREKTKLLNAESMVWAINSREALERNILETKKIAEIAHACDMPLEAELGRIPRDLDFYSAGYEFDNKTGKLSPGAKSFLESLYAIPEFAEEFVKETGCDSLAIACGSIHGMLAPLRPLNIKRIEEVSSRVNIPIVLHGSSGVLHTLDDAKKFGVTLDRDEGSIREAISAGVAKINVSTDLQRVFLDSIAGDLDGAISRERSSGGEKSNMRESCLKNSGLERSRVNMRKIFSKARERVKERIRYFIRLFGSSGKA